MLVVMDDDRLACASAALSTIHEKFRAMTEAEMAAEDNGHAFRHGMHLGWVWGRDETGRVYLDFLSEHRMSGMGAERYFADGTSEAIEVPREGYRVTGDPGKDAESEQRYIEQNQRVYAELRERGLLPPAGANLPSQDINEFLRSGGKVKETDRE